MALLTGAAAFAAALLASALVTAQVRKYALYRELLDRPTERSSHSVPTPRGGGVAIVVVVGIALVLATIYTDLSQAVLIGLGGGALAVAAIGWIDDHRHVSPLARGLVHLLAAAWLIAWIGGVVVIDWGRFSLELGWLGSLAAALAAVWSINLYNFMDGVDGIAGTQAAVAGGAGGTLLILDGQEGLGLAALALAGASSGFLVWNWPPARIFMGDVGSGFIGFVFAGLAFVGENAGGVGVLIWLLLLYPFVFDASLTLYRRVIAGERWYDAHRSHAYQRLAQVRGSHLRVTTGMLALDVMLAALAVLSWFYEAILIPALLVATGVLTLIYLAVERLRPMRNQDPVGGHERCAR